MVRIVEFIAESSYRADRAQSQPIGNASGMTDVVTTECTLTVIGLYRMQSIKTYDCFKRTKGSLS